MWMYSGLDTRRTCIVWQLSKVRLAWLQKLVSWSGVGGAVGRSCMCNSAKIIDICMQPPILFRLRWRMSKIQLELSRCRWWLVEAEIADSGAVVRRGDVLVNLCAVSSWGSRTWRPNTTVSRSGTSISVAACRHVLGNVHQMLHFGVCDGWAQLLESLAGEYLWHPGYLEEGQYNIGTGV